MKHKIIEINENAPSMLVKHLTQKNSFNEVTFADYQDLLKEVEELNQELIDFQHIGLVKQLLFERPFPWKMNVPDEERLDDFYKLIKSIDKALMRSFRAYHMRLIDKEELEHIQQQVDIIVQSAKDRMESGYAD